MRQESKFKIDNLNNNIIEYRKTLKILLKIQDTALYPATLMDHVLNQLVEQDLPIITTDNNNRTIKEAHFRLPDYCTVFQAELTEIKEACIYLEPHKDKNIIIWTESLSSIQKKL